MRAAPIALMLAIASQAGAECGKLCDYDWGQTATAADVQTEIDAGADVNARTEYAGLTTPHLFLPNGAPEIIQTLLTAGADVTARDEYGFTPLHRAASRDTSANIQALLAAGADAKAKGKFGQTPWDYA